jgi:hypothetical protein
MKERIQEFVLANKKIKAKFKLLIIVRLPMEKKEKLIDSIMKRTLTRNMEL